MTRDKKLRLPGLPPILVVSDAEAEKAEFLICAPIGVTEPLLYLPDNLTGFCCDCGIKVQYRWHAPRKPKRLCLECFAKREQSQ